MNAATSTTPKSLPFFWHGPDGLLYAKERGADARLATAEEASECAKLEAEPLDAETEQIVQDALRA
jgi:hypothetical protein